MAESMRPTTKQRIIEALISLRNTLLAIAVILALIVGGYLLLKDQIAVQLTPEELARFRYAVGGSFNTPEGINASTTVLGAQIVSATSEQPGHDAKRVIDEYGGPDYAGWRSHDATFPQEIVVKLADNGGVDKVIFTNHPIESLDTYVKEFEVLLSAEGADGPWQLVGRWTAEQNSEVQRFTFQKTRAKYAMLRILSNYGSLYYTSLTTFEVYVTLVQPFQPGQSTVTP